MVGTTTQKKPFYKIKDAGGPASIDILSNSPTIKSGIGTPILRVHMFQKFL